MQLFASVSIAAQCCAFEFILNNRNWFYMTILNLLYISLCIHLHFSSIFVGIGGLLQLGDVLVDFFFIDQFYVLGDQIELHLIFMALGLFP